MDNQGRAKALREKGKSLREIASELGVSKSTVANYVKKEVQSQDLGEVATKSWL